jgi:hypothetical protein
MTKPQFTALFAAVIATWLAVVALNTPQKAEQSRWLFASGTAGGTSLTWAVVALARKTLA